MALGNTYCPRSPTTRPLVPTVGAAPDEVRREDQGIVGDASAVTPQGVISHLVSNDRYARSHGKVTFPAATSRR
jgi:hypothetical protein